MRTLHLGLNVENLDRSRAFYTTLGCRMGGEVASTPLGSLAMLKLPGDEFVSVELIHVPRRHVR